MTNSTRVPPLLIILNNSIINCCLLWSSVRQKAALQQSIRELKLKNNRLTRLNAELQQELKDVMQSRIAVEMSIHQLRPFSWAMVAKFTLKLLIILSAFGRDKGRLSLFWKL